MWHSKNKLPFLVAGVCKGGALTSCTFDPPAPDSVADQLHFGSLSPPLVNFAWSGYPHILLAANSGEMSQQLLINSVFTGSRDVVGVHNEADQSILLQDQFNLLFPEVKRESSKIVEKGIILRCGYGQFQHLAHEVRHDGTASATLRLQVPGTGN